MPINFKNIQFRNSPNEGQQQAGLYYQEVLWFQGVQKESSGINWGNV